MFFFSLSWMSVGQVRHGERDFFTQLSGSEVHAEVEVLLFEVVDAFGFGLGFPSGSSEWFWL